MCQIFSLDLILWIYWINRIPMTKDPEGNVREGVSESVSDIFSESVVKRLTNRVAMLCI